MNLRIAPLLVGPLLAAPGTSRADNLRVCNYIIPLSARLCLHLQRVCGLQKLRAK
jgi:hypothetical protein